MKVATKEQRKAIKRKWLQEDQGLTYLQFRRTVQFCFYDNSLMVYWSNMWLGIETDGYTHS